MSTIASAVFDDTSDSENDPDFVPDDTQDLDEKVEVSEALQSRGEKAKLVNDEYKRAKDKDRASLWASFQATVAGPSSTPAPLKAPPPKFVKVEKRHRFAGEDVVEVVEVPENSEDARKWPLWKSPSQQTENQDGEQGVVGPSTLPREPSEPPATSSTPLATVGASPTPQENQKPLDQPTPPRRPVVRPSRVNLLVPPPKPRKLTTLEKSAMDWKAHVQTESTTGTSLQDDLEMHKRGGGYLDRVEFLQRVGERREEIFDQGRMRKRRKG